MTEVAEVTEVSKAIEAKPKKVLSEARLEALKNARAKAMEKRKEMAELTQKEKELDKKVKDKLLEERISKIKTLEAVVKSKPRHSKQKKKIESSSSESSSSEEEEIKPKPRQSKPKRKTKVVPSVKDKSSDELAIELSKDELKQRFVKNAYKAGFASLFPRNNNLFG